jgi:NADH-quinone oxidoreductase subunit G
MPKLIIDNLEIEVPKGTKVIEAAERLGIMIPRFCYHPGLGSVGACRVCAVKFLEGPTKGVQMSCMIEAVDGMAVSTTDEEAVDFRKQVIEWLMLNHPHDCPVCDEGGHCLLQDMTVSGGHGIRRYLGNKWTYQDQYLGPFVQHEMNRCIHCWRCRRFYQDFSGYRDLGAMQIGYRTYFGRFSDGPLESPFSGNLIDLCPTGVYTDKPSRFKGRRWDYQRGPSVCIHCSLGCHTIPSARYREVARIESRFSEAVNGYFVCDRGRYGFDYTNHPDRPRQARIGQKEVSVEEAIREAADRLKRIIEKQGTNAIAAMGSARSSLENLGMLKRLCQLQGWREPGYFVDPSAERKIKKAVSALDSKLAASMREVEKADFVLAVGADPLNEGPMLAMALRQAYRKGGTVVVIDPRPVFLPFPFIHLPVAPGEINSLLGLLIKKSINRSEAEKLGTKAVEFYESIPEKTDLDLRLEEGFSGALLKLRESRNPILMCGTDIVQETTPSLVSNHALLLQAAKGQTGLFYLMPGANAFGAATLSSGKGSLVDTVEAIEKGSVKALLLLECDPFRLFPDRERLKRAFERLDFLLVFDFLPSEVARQATIFLPTRTLFEADATFINQEGRAQRAFFIHHGGIPIEQLTGGNHPPRSFRTDIPGGESSAAWQILAELGAALSKKGDSISRDELWDWLVREHSALADIHSDDELLHGRRVRLDQRQEPPFAPDASIGQAKTKDLKDQLELMVVDWTFGTEELSAYSKYSWKAEKEPLLLMHAEEAARLDLHANDKVVLDLDGGSVEVKVQLLENMARGVMVLPRHRQIAWQKAKTFPAAVPVDKIKKL